MPQSPSWRVAVVVDDAELRSLLRILIDLDDRLEWAGGAGNGIAGVHLVRREKPDVVILDVDMPGLDGLRALAALRLAGVRAKVVLYTSQPLPRRGRVRMADAVFAKSDPISITLDRIIDVVQHERSSAPTERIAQAP